jgi:flagellar hook-associated protein 2
VRDAFRNKGLNVVGSINGVPALGASQVLTLTGQAPLASPGRYVGTKTDFAPYVVPAGISFTVNVDGIESNTVAADVGTYQSGTALAANLELKINADLALKAAGKSVSVSFDEGGRAFTFVSDATGSSSSVGFVTVPPATAQALGVKEGFGLPGHPGGSTADAAGGAQLKVIGGAAGDRGSLTIVRGIMHELDRLFSGVLGGFGTLANRADALNGQLSAIARESARVDVRINATEARLRTQFAAADKAISQLNSTSSFLQQQLASLNSSGRD